MFHYHLTFASPAYLLLLALVPVLLLASYRRLAALGPWRRWVALLLRGSVAALVILALAEVQIVQTSDRLTVVYLLDQSFSIPAERRQALIDYINADMHQRRKGKDRVGVVVFGRDAAIEIPPFDDDVQVAQTIESVVDPEYTNLAAAMKLAQAIFPEDAAKRIVLVSDGNQNLGNAMEQAQALAGAGVGIDVVPIHYRTRAEIIVERVAIPPDVRRGEPFDLRVVITNTAQATAKDSGEVPGRLVLSRMAGGRTDVLSDQPVVLPPGKKVFTIRQKIDAAEFLHLRGPLRPRPQGRRRHAAEQPRHGLHPHPGQGPGAVDRGSRASGRVRRAGRSAAAAGARGGSAIEQPDVHHRWPSCSPTTPCCWPTCPASSSATRRSPCSRGTRSRWGRAW